jgi:tRNA-Thr(GGU) m(6)t(6)A37 methyltransferase TsaA
MNSNATFQVRPIGYTREGNEGFRIELAEPFWSALKELNQFSHVQVLWWASQLDDEASRSLTQAELPYAKGVVSGVFACRSPYRPNPILLTTCQIIRVDEEQGIVWVDYIDAMEGTPVLDLKPYIPVSDRVRDVRVPYWFAEWPEWIEDGEAFFANTQIDCPGM